LNIPRSQVQSSICQKDYEEAYQFNNEDERDLQPTILEEALTLVLRGIIEAMEGIMDVLVSENLKKTEMLHYKN